MKNFPLFLLLLLTISLSITSCKDDDVEQSPASLLIGSWKFSTYVASECTDPNDNETETCTVDCDTVTFTADLATYGDGGTDPYTVNGNQLTLGTGSGADVFEFSVSASALILTQSDGDCKEVSTLTRN